MATPTDPSLDQKVHLGDQVMYVLDSGPNVGSSRPAIVVRHWSGNFVNLAVYVDGTNDIPSTGLAAPVQLTQWMTSIDYANRKDDGSFPRRTWHWMGDEIKPR